MFFYVAMPTVIQAPTDLDCYSLVTVTGAKLHISHPL